MDTPPLSNQGIKKGRGWSYIALLIIPVLLTVGFSFISQTKIVNQGIDKCVYNGWPFHTRVQESKAITQDEFQQKIASGQIQEVQGITPSYFSGPQCSLPGGIVMYVANFAVFLVAIGVISAIYKLAAKKKLQKPTEQTPAA